MIELLVVISIVSLLSSVVLSAVNTARVRADDTQRNQIVEEYVKALTLVYDKAGGKYPDTGSTTLWCLGDYPPTGPGNYGTSRACRFAYNAPYWRLHESTIVNSAVLSFLPSLPTIKPVTYTSYLAYDGPFYRCRNIGCSQAQILWYLKQYKQKCIKGAYPSTVYAYSNGVWNAGTRCNLNLN